MPTNLIVNGALEGPNNNPTGWSGSDIESRTEKTYLRNGQTDHVVEMNGRANQITVLEQSFSVTDPSAATLSLDAALRASGPVASGVDGFKAQVLDSGGVVIFETTVLPATSSMVTYTFSVNFTSAGTYTLRFTEVGDIADSFGAVIDDISLIVCFARGTKIDTDGGAVAIEHLQAGDKVVTLDHGTQEIRWIGSRRVTTEWLARDPSLRPVRIRAGALGKGFPDADLCVSRQHRMLLRSAIAQRMYGVDEILVPAHKLVSVEGIEIIDDLEDVEYFHILFDDHQIVTANGALSESLYTGTEALKALSSDARLEIQALFPEVFAPEWRPVSSRLMPRRGRKLDQLLKRHRANAKPLFLNRHST